MQKIEVEIQKKIVVQPNAHYELCTVHIMHSALCTLCSMHCAHYALCTVHIMQYAANGEKREYRHTGAPASRATLTLLPIHPPPLLIISSLFFSFLLSILHL